MARSNILVPLILLCLRWTTTEVNCFDSFSKSYPQDGIKSKPKYIGGSTSNIGSRFDQKIKGYRYKTNYKQSNHEHKDIREYNMLHEDAAGSETVQQRNKADKGLLATSTSSLDVQLYEQASIERVQSLKEDQTEEEALLLSEVENDSHLGKANQDHSDLHLGKANQDHSDLHLGKAYQDHSDYFICGPCNCSTTAHNLTHVIAHCQRSDMRDIPRKVSNFLWSLEMYETSLVSLNMSKILEYSTLVIVNITQNKQLTTVTYDNSGGIQKSAVTDLILNDNNISQIEDNSFNAFVSLKNLCLQNNRIRNITNTTFAMLGNLFTLDLSHNIIKVIDTGAFTQLRKLKVLDLSYNRRMGYSVKYLPPGLLTPLKSLGELSIQGISNGEKRYPNQALSKLFNLRYLTIDGLNDEFGIEFRNLKNLVSIRLTSNSLKVINQTFFENTPRLKAFEIFQSSLSYVNTSAYKQVKLTSLTLRNLVNYDLFTAFDDLQGLQHSQLKSLSFIRLYHRTFPCRFLNKLHARYLTNIALERLDLSENLIALLGQDFADLLPKTLNTLILRDNKFSLRGNVVVLVSHLFELKELDLSIQNHDKLRGGFQEPLFDQTEPTKSCQVKSSDSINSYSTCERCHQILQTGNCEKGFENNHSLSESKLLFLNNGKRSSNVLNSDETNDIFNDTGDLVLRNKEESEIPKLSERENITNNVMLPPKLSILNASQFFIFGTTVLSPTWFTSKLRVLDLSKSFLSSWGSGAMLPRIERAFLSENYCKHIRPNFFRQNNSLIYLDLHDNALGADFADDVDGVILSELSRLKYLDISFNVINSLPYSFFRGPDDLRFLKLSDNKLQVLNTTFSQMTRLQYLDLSRNSIAWISKHVRDDLDRIGGDLSVDLTLNPLPCTCAAIDLLDWMANTNAHLLKKDFLQCRFDSGETEFIGDLDNRVISLKRMCTSKILVIVICVASLVVIGVIVSFGLMYKHRWKLRYMLNITKARLSGFKPKGATEVRYKFDAYVIYGDETRSFVLKEFTRELEEKRGHRLCLEDRDFMPGSPIIPDILSGVQNSFKTIPVITPEFYDDGDHTEYSVQMALMEENYQKRQVLHLCIYESMGHGDMGEDLYTAMRRNSYTEFPPLEDASVEMLQNFWDQLSEVIGHTSGSDLADDGSG